MPKPRKSGKRVIKQKPNPEAEKAKKLERQRQAKIQAEKKLFPSRPRNFGIGK